MTITLDPDRAALISQVLVLRSRGVPFLEIAKRLGITKNAAIGIAHRSKPLELAKPLEDPRRLSRFCPSVEHLHSDGCQWGHGHPSDPGFRFCGAERSGPGKPYCAAHQARAWTPMRRAAGKFQLFARPGKAA